MTIASVLQYKGRDVIRAAPSNCVRDVVNMLCEHRIGAVLVIDGDTVIGVVSERDIIRGLQEKGAAILDSNVTVIMTADVLTVTPDDAVLDALALMTRRRIRHLPVMSGGRLSGLVSIGDLVKRRIEIIEHEAASLRDYIRHA